MNINQRTLRNGQGWRTAWLFIGCAFAWLGAVFGGETGGHVLFISSYSDQWGGVARQIIGLKEALEPHATIKYLFMNSKTLAPEAAENTLRVRLQADKTAYNVVILGDDAAFNFGVANHKKLFAGLPLIFEGVNNIENGYAAAKNPLVTGVVETFALPETIALIRQIYPQVRKIAAITDDTLTGQGLARQFVVAQKGFPELQFTTINSSTLTRAEISATLAKLPVDTALLFLLMTNDKDGNVYTQPEALQLLAASAARPLFTADENGVGDGILLGGKAISYQAMGRIAGEMALQVLRGQRPQNIPVVKVPQRYIIDQAVMKRFQLDKSQFPADTHYLNFDATAATAVDTIK